VRAGVAVRVAVAVRVVVAGRVRAAAVRVRVRVVVAHREWRVGARRKREKNVFRGRRVEIFFRQAARRPD
jgi:hypothetical protein